MSDPKEIARRLAEYEARVLLTCCGKKLSGWGAAVGEALGVLTALGLTTARGTPTDLGRAVAKELEQSE